MSSSREDAIARLRKWTAAKAPIRASFVGKGLTFNTKGRIVFDEAKDMVWLVRGDEKNPQVALSLSLLAGIPCESFEPLRDAPEEFKFRMDFFAAEAFRLPYGDVDFREIIGEED